MFRLPLLRLPLKLLPSIFSNELQIFSQAQGANVRPIPGHFAIPFRGLAYHSDRFIPHEAERLLDVRFTVPPRHSTVGAILERRSELPAYRTGALLLYLIEPNGIAFGDLLKIYTVPAVNASDKM